MGSQRSICVVHQSNSAVGHAAVALDGARMTTTPTVFGEFSTAFQFPGYFGQNWDAFNECIGDFLADHADEPVPVLISHAGLLLTDASDQEFVTLIAILTSVGESELSRLVVSLADDELGIAHIQERLHRNGLPFTTG